MFGTRKFGAAAAAFALIAGSLGLAALVLAAPAEAAAPPGTLTCNTFNNLAAFQTTWTTTNTFSVSPANVAPGGTVQATWTSANFPNGSPTTLDQGTVQVQVLIAVSGQQTGDIVAVTAPGSYPASNIATGLNLGPITATTSFTASMTPGALNYTVKQVVFKSGNGSTADTYCSPHSGNFPATTDPSITSALLPGYTPDWQTASSVPPGYGGFDVGKISGTATTVATAANSITSGSTESATPSPTPTDTQTTSSPSPSNTKTTTSSSPSASKTPTVSGAPRSASSTQVTYCDVSNTALKALAKYSFPLKITVTPGAAAPGSTVSVSVAVDGSPINTGPATIAPKSYRMEASIKFNGASTELIGPTNNGTIAALTGPLFAKSQLPTVATGAITLPSTQGSFPVTINDIYYNNISGTGTAGSLTDLFDQRCNASSSPQKSPKPFTAPAVSVESNVNAASASADPSSSSSSNVGGSGSTLAATGGREVIVFGLLGLLLLQFGAVFTVRAVRASPRGPRHL